MGKLIGKHLWANKIGVSEATVYKLTTGYEITVQQPLGGSVKSYELSEAEFDTLVQQHTAWLDLLFRAQHDLD